MTKRIIYSKGSPYGAPLKMIRGGGTKDQEVRDYLKAQGFRWDGNLFAWCSYIFADAFVPVLRELRDGFGCEVVVKEGTKYDAYDLDADYDMEREVDA